MRRLILRLILILHAASALPASAAPTAYALQQDQSRVGFSYMLAGIPAKGAMPVLSAEILIDTKRLERSSVDVKVDVTRARAGFIIATEALKSPSVLNAVRYPQIRFRSTGIRLNGQGRLSDGAQIDGQLTVRGVTLPVTLQAALYRPADTAPDDLRRLRFSLSGQVSRTAFGAAGYSGLVDDLVTLRITAYVEKKD
ncbi:MAG: YceI family protein [Litoreibacter sp.]|nr:YceI family protein [Litoreibacter sp.]